MGCAMTDYKALVIRAQAGNLEAFGKLVILFQDKAVGYAYSVLGDFHLAEDVAQEAFIKAFFDLTRLENPAAFPGWLRRIVFKYCDRILRKSYAKTTPIELAGVLVSDENGVNADLVTLRGSYRRS